MVVTKLDLGFTFTTFVKGSLVVASTSLRVRECVLHEHTIQEVWLRVCRCLILVVSRNYGRVVVCEVVSNILGIDDHTLLEVVTTTVILVAGKYEEVLLAGNLWTTWSIPNLEHQTVALVVRAWWEVDECIVRYIDVPFCTIRPSQVLCLCNQGVAWTVDDGIVGKGQILVEVWLAVVTWTCEPWVTTAIGIITAFIVEYTIVNGQLFNNLTVRTLETDETTNMATECTSFDAQFREWEWQSLAVHIHEVVLGNGTLWITVFSLLVKVVEPSHWVEVDVLHDDRLDSQCHTILCTRACIAAQSPVHCICCSLSLAVVKPLVISTVEEQ